LVEVVLGDLVKPPEEEVLVRYFKLMALVSQ
jgi:hypothetical protein